MEPKKRKYAEFYKNLDVQKDFERMRDVGVFHHLGVWRRRIDRRGRSGLSGRRICPYKHLLTSPSGAADTSLLSQLTSGFDATGGSNVSLLLIDRADAGCNYSRAGCRSVVRRALRLPLTESSRSLSSIRRCNYNVISDYIRYFVAYRVVRGTTTV
ncbi:hypothetical protein LSAT2_014593 [Lamellibrachia satsuma]|nr:hypothetical protein LSAT2_014593 [Lamellibrachia satsuma]